MSSGILMFFVIDHPKVLIDQDDLNTFALCPAEFNGQGRVKIFTNGKKEYLYRAIMGFPADSVDHINGNTLDNRKENLRICSQRDNTRNRGIGTNNTSGAKGVRLFVRTGKWAASIKVNYKNIFLGYYKTKEEAITAYNNAAIRYFGEFAKLNE